jgi:hypothetical protein
MFALDQYLIKDGDSSFALPIEDVLSGRANIAGEKIRKPAVFTLAARFCELPHELLIQTFSRC